MSFDPLNILLLAIALVVFWRLKSVLGTRTGNERPPTDPFGTRPADSKTAAEPKGTVLRFPQAPEPAPQTGVDREPAPPVWTGFAEAGTPLAGALEKLSEADPSFTPRDFVEGAKAAYEMTIEGFAKGDKNTLKNLLSKDVYDGFSRAIDEREAAGRRIEQRFVGIEKANIQSASLVGNKASITMAFVSELISATYEKSGGVVEGDPREIREVTDVWTFERDVTSRNPNWKLVATQAPA
jgi:predicted lipid-binding transport protein (Tim44 family)